MYFQSYFVFTLTLTVVWIHVASTSIEENNDQFYPGFQQDMGNISEYYGCDEKHLQYIKDQATRWARINYSPGDIIERKAYAYSIGMVKYDRCMQKFLTTFEEKLKEMGQMMEQRSCDSNCLNEHHRIVEMGKRILYYVAKTLKRFINKDKSEYGEITGSPLIPIYSNPAPVYSVPPQIKAVVSIGITAFNFSLRY